MREEEKTRFARRMRRNITPAEKLLWWKLKDKQQGWKFHRQKTIGPFVADFACLEVLLVIEIDGATHSTKEEIEYDAGRTRFLSGTAGA
jgi:very-short-patch-repair endonuclease